MHKRAPPIVDPPPDELELDDPPPSSSPPQPASTSELADMARIVSRFKRLDTNIISILP
jgi:hypothetical protein